MAFRLPTVNVPAAVNVMLPPRMPPPESEPAVVENAPVVRLASGAFASVYAELGEKPVAEPAARLPAVTVVGPKYVFAPLTVRVEPGFVSFMVSATMFVFVPVMAEEIVPLPGPL